MSNYSNDHKRLMSTVVGSGLVAGYVVESETTEKLYAVDHTGNILVRTAKRGCDSFNGKGWSNTDSVPSKAEYIGAYKLEL